MSDAHADLATRVRFLPRGGIKRTTWLGPIRRLGGLQRVRSVPGVEITTVNRSAPIRLYRPIGLSPPSAALLWIHGGGLVMGRPQMDDQRMGTIASELGILVASVDYRLAPEHPYPAPLDDCWGGFEWLHAEVGVDSARIAVGGASAGGGLAAGLAQLALDRKRPLAFQLLVYPMIDDRSAVQPGIDEQHFRLWNQASNRFGWASYLGQEPGLATVRAPAAPARRVDLSGLAPAWVGVGTHDLFHDEDTAYARRLVEAGVPCHLEIVPGAFHGFDVIAPKATVSRGFLTAQIRALRQGLGLPAVPAESGGA